MEGIYRTRKRAREREREKERESQTERERERGRGRGWYIYICSHNFSSGKLNRKRHCVEGVCQIYDFEM